MTPLTSLWLPILLSAVVVFMASSLVHMVLPWHKSDYPRVPNEDRLREAVRPLGIPPGDYMVPRAPSSREMRDPEFLKKLSDGPNLILTVMPSGQWTMGKLLGQWFVFCLVVSVFAAYIAGSALSLGATYLQVFRFAGTTAFIGYALALWPISIWYRRAWSMTFKSTFDGLLYALLTAGVFGWLWPRS